MLAKHAAIAARGISIDKLCPNSCVRGKCTIAHSTALAVTDKSGESTGQVRFRLARYPQPLNWDKWGEYVLQRIDTDVDADEVISMQQAERVRDSAYFSYYDDPAVHEAIIGDQRLMLAYEDLIQRNAHLIKDKVVLDVGAGMGLLAMMCAKAGAKHVYAVEGSETTAAIASKIVKANNLGSAVTVIAGSLEERGIPTHKVDVIISNWMGSMLISEGMARSVIYARNKFLAPGGLILPQRGTIHAVGVEDRAYLSEKKDFWGEMYGVDMGCAMQQVVGTARVDTLPRKSQIVTDSAPLCTVDLATASAADVMTFKQLITLTAQRDERLFGLMLYFDVEAGSGWQLAGASSSETSEPMFTTDPRSPVTHFQQVILDFPRSIKLNKGEELVLHVSCSPRAEDPRTLRLEVEINFQGKIATAQYVVLK